MLKDFLCVALGGALGSMLRYGISVLGAYFQWSSVGATFTANVLGSLLMGLVLILCANNSLFLFATVGLCGGFTTFSTFSAQTLTYFEAGNYVWGIGYALFSVMTCVVAVAVGAYLAKLIS